MINYEDKGLASNRRILIQTNAQAFLQPREKGGRHEAQENASQATKEILKLISSILR